MYLSQGLIPIQNTGKEVTSLDYDIEDKHNDEPDMRLFDEDILKLADSIKNNKKFSGPLNLENN